MNKLSTPLSQYILNSCLGTIDGILIQTKASPTVPVLIPCRTLITGRQQKGYYYQNDHFLHIGARVSEVHASAASRDFQYDADAGNECWNCHCCQLDDASRHDDDYACNH